VLDIVAASAERPDARGHAEVSAPAMMKKIFTVCPRRKKLQCVTLGGTRTSSFHPAELVNRANHGEQYDERPAGHHGAVASTMDIIRNSDASTAFTPAETQALPDSTADVSVQRSSRMEGRTRIILRSFICLCHGQVAARFPILRRKKNLRRLLGGGYAGRPNNRPFMRFYPKRERYLRPSSLVLSIQGLKATFLPRDPSDNRLLVEAIRPTSPMTYVVIGIRGPVAQRQCANGLMGPIVYSTRSTLLIEQRRHQKPYRT